MSKPIAVIRKLEDSPEWLDRRLVEAYLRTSYAIALSPDPPVRIGEANPLFEAWLDKQSVASYAFITAWNPRSVLLDPEENERRNDLLEEDLKPLCRFVGLGFGFGDNGHWTGEESCIAFGIAAEEVIRLGRKYDQNAIVWWEKGGLPELWWLAEAR